MLPRLGEDTEREQDQRPSLPSIRDLFGEHLARPVDKRSSFMHTPSRPSPFSLSDLRSSLPVDSRPGSPAESQGSLLSSQASSRPTWPYGSDYNSYSPRINSESTFHQLTTPSTSSSHDQFITLPPIRNYAWSHEHDTIAPNTSRAASRRISEMHGRSRSSSEAIASNSVRRTSGTPPDSHSKRRHTIGPSPEQLPYSIELTSRQGTHGHASPYSAGRSYPSFAQRSTRTLPGRSSSPVPSPLPSPSTTSGEEAPPERRKSTARYQCEYCGKRFNRPSSLKIHNNTHTGEKPFACPIPDCGRRFSVMSNMRRHMRIHGESSASQPRENSMEELRDVPSPAYSSASSNPNTPTVAPHPTASPTYTHSHSSSASSSPRIPSSKHLSSSSRPRSRSRCSKISRPYPYRISDPLSSDEASSPEF